MKRILVVEDDPLLIKTFRKLLQEEGYEVAVAASGFEALRVAEEQTFDLTICDLRMPSMDGFETIRQTREIYRKKGLAHPPELLISGYPYQDEAALKGLSPAAFLEKPFGVEELLKEVRRILFEPNPALLNFEG